MAPQHEVRLSLLLGCSVACEECIPSSFNYQKHHSLVEGAAICLQDFARADAIRDELTGHDAGIVVEDLQAINPYGVTMCRAIRDW